MRKRDFWAEEASVDELLLGAVLSELEGLDDHALRQIVAVRMVERIKQDLGGERRYIPRPSLSGRNARILLEYRNGARVSELAKRYDLTESRIYQIIGAKRHGLSESTTEKPSPPP